MLLEFRRPVLLMLKKNTKNKSQNSNSLGDWVGLKPFPSPSAQTMGILALNVFFPRIAVLRPPHKSQPDMTMASICFLTSNPLRCFAAGPEKDGPGRGGLAGGNQASVSGRVMARPSAAEGSYAGSAPWHPPAHRHVAASPKPSTSTTSASANSSMHRQAPALTPATRPSSPSPG